MNDLSRGTLERSEGSPSIDAWERHFATLIEFKLRQGHCGVPTTQAEPSFLAWVSRMRTRHRAGKLRDSYFSRLSAVGFVWDPKAMEWEAHFGELKALKASQGHCKIPAGQPHLALRRWLAGQRVIFRDGQMSHDRQVRFGILGVDWVRFARDRIPGTRHCLYTVSTGSSAG